MSKSIVGIAKSTSQVETTLADLQNNGLVPASDISLLMPDSGPAPAINRSWELSKLQRLLKEQRPERSVGAP